MRERGRRIVAVEKVLINSIKVSLGLLIRTSWGNEGKTRECMDRAYDYFVDGKKQRWCNRCKVGEPHCSIPGRSMVYDRGMK